MHVFPQYQIKVKSMPFLLLLLRDRQASRIGSCEKHFIYFWKKQVSYVGGVQPMKNLELIT